MQFRFSKYRLVLGTVFLSLVGTLAYTQTEVRIRELTEVTADGISSDGAVWFGVDKTDVPASRKISLAELKKTGVQVENVIRYGADPTGVASSTTAFDDAVDAAIASDHALYIPAGTYILTAWTQKTISGDLTIVGDGKDVVLITGPTPIVSMFMMNEGASIQMSGVGFTDWLNVVHVNANPTVDHESLVVDSCLFDDVTRPIQDEGGTTVLGLKEFRFNRSTVTNGLDGIRIRASALRFAEITGNIVDTITNSAGCTGITILANTGGTTNCEQAIISGNKIRDITSSGSSVETHGIMAQGRAMHITDNRIENVNNANATSDEGLYTKSQNCVVTGNVLINAGGGEGQMNIKGEDKGTASPPSPYGYASVVSGNVIVEESSGEVILMQIHMDDCTVNSNVLQGGFRGIICNGLNVAITDNTITDGTSSYSEATAILLQDVNGGVVSNNAIKNWQQYGILVRASTAGTRGNLLISANRIEDINNTGYGIFNFCTVSQVNVTISNNFIKDTTTGGVLFSEAGLTGSTFTVDGNVFVNPGVAIGNTGAAAVLRSDNVVDGSRMTTITGATPTRAATDVMKTNNGSPITMTAISGGVVGDEITVIIGDANTTIDFTGTTLKGNNGSDWVPASGDHMTCTFDGTNWYCVVSEN